jgi:hypothetical protein
VLHQAALAAGGIIFMDNTFFCCFIQSADGFAGSLNGLFLRAIRKGGAGFLYECTGATGVDTVAQTTFLVLLVSLDLGLDIRQLDPPINTLLSQSRGAILHEAADFVQTQYGLLFPCDRLVKRAG